MFLIESSSGTGAGPPVAAARPSVKVATDPRRAENFRWHNTGLTNTPHNPDEYPVEFLYREVLSKEQLLEALSFSLVRVPAREAEDDKPAHPAFTLFPRYHQARLVRNVAANVTDHFASTGNIGKKYLAEHSPGSGKTLSICWLADRLHSLYKPGTSEKLVDITFILTDRKSLDTNIREDVANFTHLKDVVGIAGYVLNVIPYSRNLILVYRKRREERVARGFEPVVK
jgi:type I restriction enzyme R subunit